MKINVTDNNTMESIFEGEADEFLEVNEYDEEIEEALNELDTMDIGETTIIYGNFTDTFTIEKLEDDELFSN